MDYSRARQTAMRMISKNGLTYKLTRGGEIEIVDGIEKIKEEQVFQIKGVRFNYSNAEMVNPQSAYVLSNSLIQAGDIKLMTTADVEILAGDFVEVDGVRHRVINTNPFKPASVVIYYELQLRA